MAIEDTSGEGKPNKGSVLAETHPETTPATVEDINAKLDLLLQAQGIVYERE